MEHGHGLAWGPARKGWVAESRPDSETNKCGHEEEPGRKVPNTVAASQQPAEPCTRAGLQGPLAQASV